MSDTEDPYAVSSDSEDEDKRKGPPPKINIEGRLVTDLNKFKETLVKEKEGVVKDEERLKEIEELKKTKAEETKKMKKDFEEGKHLDTEVKKGVESLEGVGKENLVNMKEMFEKAPTKEFTKEKDALEDLIRSETDKKRIRASFEPPKEDEPKDCALCSKIVYPVERLVANKKLYHVNCFRCAKCNKKLTPISYNIHEGVLYCKPHVLEVLHPDRTGSLDEDDDEPVVQDEDEEFAVVSKPKHLSSQVVRAGQTNISDELAQIRSLKETKANLASSINEAQQTADKRISVAEEISAGKVKANKEILSSAPESSQLDDEKKKQLDEIRAQVSEIKNKWKTGEVEKAETKEASTKEELEELKKGPKVRERFNLPSEVEGVTKSYDHGELNTSAIAEARKSFLEGSAFQTGPVEKSAKDLEELKFSGLNSFKERFEKGPEEAAEKRDRAILDIHVQLKNLKSAIEKGGEAADMTPEDRAEHKKKEIEAEFLRYKLARKIQAKKTKDQGEPTTAADTSDADSNKLDVEIKMAGKAREKFKNIDAQNPHAPIPTSKSPTPSKWDTKKETTAEVVNKRVVEESSSEEDEGEFDVKNLMNKFKNIDSTGGSKLERKLDELEALRLEAKNLREKFEKTKLGEDADLTDEKRKHLEEEFKHLKEERERAQQELQAELESKKNVSTVDKEEIQIAADHASKMSAKFEKIIKKETKKAEKSKMPAKA